MQLFEEYRSQFIKYGVDTDLRKAMFMTHAEHESNLEPVQENLMYSADGLLKTFGKYFKDKLTALKYARHPQMIANLVYGSRMGNERDGINDNDGWEYSGKGYFQLTGEEMYELCAKETGLDCLNHPEILLTKDGAIISALWFWKHKKLNQFADKKDVVGATKRINGGVNGLKERTILYRKWCKVFNIKL